MVKIHKVYTRTGDDGTTGLIGGRRVAKNALRVAAYGDIDETNSLVGYARTIAQNREFPEMVEQLEAIQHDLFDIGAILATPHGESHPSIPTIEGSHISRLEAWIDLLTESLPELRSFVLPGGTELTSVLHLARAVCRRAERTILALNDEEPVSPTVLQYVNRLSDLLFTLARDAARREGAPEFLWVPGRTSKVST